MDIITSSKTGLPRFLRRGDVVKVTREFLGVSVYDHYGVYVGNNKVVHYSAPGKHETSAKNARIIETSLSEFEKDGTAEQDNLTMHSDFSGEQIARKAESEVGSKFGGYGLLTNNCEHFARWCESGTKYSEQVRNDLDIAFNPVRGLEEIGERIGDMIDVIF